MRYTLYVRTPSLSREAVGEPLWAEACLVAATILIDNDGFTVRSALCEGLRVSR